jgi:hypothetical protein
MLDEVLNISLRAPFRLCREALGTMGEGGSILFIGSTWGLYGTPGGGAYSTVKAGQIGLNGPPHRHPGGHLRRKDVGLDAVAQGHLCARRCRRKRATKERRLPTASGGGDGHSTERKSRTHPGSGRGPGRRR